MSLTRPAIALLCLIALGAAGCSDLQPRPGYVPPRRPLRVIQEEFQAYADKHVLLFEVAAPDWAGAVARLAAEGDHHTLVLLRSLDRASLDPPKLHALDQAIAALEARCPEPYPPLTVHLVQQRLERAALCDLSGPPLQPVYGPWLLRSIHARLNEPGIREEVSRIALGYVPGTDDETLIEPVRTRVCRYAAAIVAAKSSSELTTSGL